LIVRSLIGAAGLSTRPKPWPKQSQTTGQSGFGRFSRRLSSMYGVSPSGSQTERALCWADGSDAGEAEYVERIKPGEMVWLQADSKCVSST
jgi:hypothetical protein